MSVLSAQSIDPGAVMAIRHLELRARVVVEGFLTGLHRSPFHGFSVEFTEYRQYTVGEDTRFVDWKLYGRTDRYFIKKFEDETNLRCYFIVDRSRSMSFGSVGYDKMSYSSTLAASLAYFLSLQGDAAGLLTFSDQVREFLPARHRPGHLRQFMLKLERAPDGSDTQLDPALQKAAELIRKRGLLVIISDFLAPLDSLEKRFGELRAWGHEIEAFQVLDPAELELSFSDSTLFRDLETQRELYIDPTQARAEYKRRLEEHGQNLAAICRKLGVHYHRVPTNRPLGQSLLEFLLNRRHAGKVIRRRSAGRI